MSSHTVRQGTVNGTAPYLRANKFIAHELPPPEETWTIHDVPDAISENLHKLLAKHAIEVAGRVPVSENSRQLYRTTAGAHSFVQERLDAPTTLSCGHSGIKNLGDDEYTCGFEPCEIRVGREAAREVLSG